LLYCIFETSILLKFILIISNSKIRTIISVTMNVLWLWVISNLSST